MKATKCPAKKKKDGGKKGEKRGEERKRKEKVKWTICCKLNSAVVILSSLQPDSDQKAARLASKRVIRQNPQW